MSEPGCRRAPLAQYPGMNRFVLDWLAAQPQATRFLPRQTTTPTPRRREIPQDLVDALDASNRHWGFFVSDELRRWASGETVTLIAGQQVGFAGGPLYTLAKIATLLRMKRDLEAAGTPTTAFFWLATEDHDFAEVATLAMPLPGINKQLDLVTLRAAHAVESKEIVGPQPIPETLIGELLSLCDAPRPQWLREGITFRDSFAELLATVLEGKELILIDALLPELRRAGATLFGDITARWNDIQRSIADRSQELEAAGYSPQIVARDGEPYTLLFHIDAHGTRKPLNAGDEIVDAEKTSTSALTRPLLQDRVFAPDIFVGGPAEVAYYAQIGPLYPMFDIAQPRVALRGHALVAPKRIVRYFERFELECADAFTSPDAILADQEPERVAEVKSIAAEAQRDLLQRIEQIGALALPADHALARSINRSIGHLDYHFGKLAERAIRGLVRKDRERWTAVRELVATFHPDGHVQDRVVGWLAFWCAHGRHLIDRLVDEIEPDSDSFKIVGL